MGVDACPSSSFPCVWELVSKQPMDLRAPGGAKKRDPHSGLDQGAKASTNLRALGQNGSRQDSTLTDKSHPPMTWAVGGDNSPRGCGAL